MLDVKKKRDIKKNNKEQEARLRMRKKRRKEMDSDKAKQNCSVMFQC